MQFSIIIPTLNEEKYIGKLLSCLTNQTYQDFEVIVVNGKSTDHTLSEISKFNHRLKIRVIDAPQPGVARQRNLGASRAVFAHLIFFDADVQPQPDFLFRLNNYLQHHPADALTSWNIPLSHNLFDHLVFSFFNLFVLSLFQSFHAFAVGTFIYCTRDSFQSVGGFDPNLLISEDFEFIQRLFQSGIKFKVLVRPPIYFSVRRLEKEGRLAWLAHMLAASWVYLIHGFSHPRFRNSSWHSFGRY